MDLLTRIDRRWRAFRHPEAVASEQYYSAEQQQRPPQLVPAVAEVSAAQAVGEEITAQDFRGPSLYGDIHGQSSGRDASPDYGVRSSTGAVQVTALAGYDFLDSATISDSSRMSTPLRVQGFDEIELDPKPATGKSRLTTATAPSPSIQAGAAAEKPVSRRSLAARVIAAAEAIAWSTGQQLVAARSTLSHLLRKASASHLPTAASPVAAAAAVGPARKSTWQRHPCTAVGCLLLLLVLTAAVVGVAIGVTAGVKGQFPWWARGPGARNEPELWVPSGDSQLDSLMQLKAAVDSNNLLTDWQPHKAANGGYCSWDFVTCDKSQTVVEGINLTTNSFMFVLKGQLPSGDALSGLTGLKSLDIREHHISGPLPEDWYQLSLQVIKLDQNKLDGELPAAWFTEPPLSSSLRVLTLWDNKLTGTLPETTGTMQNLQDLDLSFNGFEGQLPGSWSSMTSLRQLWVDVNRLSGSLPASWSDMRALERLMLSENSLTGALPPSWSAMKSLKELWLEYNQLTGPLPDTYSSLSQLQTLVLNNNNLSRSVPKTWTGLKQLQSVYLYNNQELSGCVPGSWKAQFAEDFDADYFLLEGTGLTGFCGTS